MPCGCLCCRPALSLQVQQLRMPRPVLLTHPEVPVLRVIIKAPVLKNIGESQSIQDSGRHTYVSEMIPRVLRLREADPLHLLLPPSRTGRPDSTHAMDLLLLAVLALQVLRQLRAVEQTIPRVVTPSKIDDSGTAMDRLAPIH